MHKSGDARFLQAYRNRLVEWRRQPTVNRIEKPTRVERARALGYRENHLNIVTRVKVRKGHPLNPRPRAGRRPKKMGVKKLTLKITHQRIAEQRAQKRYRNMRVVGSYLAGEDGEHQWYEVVLSRSG